MIILNIFISLISVSIVEYLMHRYYLHIKTHSHILHHHKVFNTNTQNFYHEDSKFSDIASSFSYLLVMAILSLFIIFPILIFFKQSIVVSIITTIIYIIWTELIHFLFHIKYRAVFSNNILYKNLETHHLIHHSKYNTNFGIGSTHIDYIFNTKFKIIKL